MGSIEREGKVSPKVMERYWRGQPQAQTHSFPPHHVQQPPPPPSVRWLSHLFCFFLASTVTLVPPDDSDHPQGPTGSSLPANWLIGAITQMNVTGARAASFHLDSGSPRSPSLWLQTSTAGPTTDNYPTRY
ncbi:hypothetical protein M747DRAFT_155236 [Aspergillus niger ATCC 13496]|uniref:Uncharacterized protein n=1 Tax=Aspergillus niger ATCC 13496 TaxID=1353008 RepID=A0A370C781_ASPNG|nr:hypothetical protein M747DRAFT_155236 [Aspergillus niger ATCC 13496]